MFLRGLFSVSLPYSAPWQPLIYFLSASFATFWKFSVNGICSVFFVCRFLFSSLWDSAYCCAMQLLPPHLVWYRSSITYKKNIQKKKLKASKTKRKTGISPIPQPLFSYIYTHKLSITYYWTDWVASAMTRLLNTDFYCQRKCSICCWAEVPGELVLHLNSPGFQQNIFKAGVKKVFHGDLGEWVLPIKVN